MEKRLSNSDKGVTLMVLIITIVVLLIITIVGVHTSLERIKANDINKMFNDIELLEDKTLEYYVVDGELPVISNVSYPNIAGAGENATDLKVIDLSKLGNTSLNFGRDFEKLKNETTITSTNFDVYVINEKTLQVFYSKGITVNKKTYYTKENRDVQIITAGDNKVIIEIQGEKVDSSETGKDDETNISYYEEGIDSYYCKDVRVRYEIVKNKLDNTNLKVDIYYGVDKDNITTLKESIEPGIKELSDVGYYEIKLESKILKEFKLTHKWRTWSTKQEKIYCTDTGTNIKTCEKCGEEREQAILPTEHEWKEWTTTEPATCIKQGIETRECIHCKKKEERNTPLTDHQWGEWQDVLILDGDYVIIKKRNCKICQAEETQRKPLVSKEEKKAGYYADIDADGTVDGVIYADLAQGGSGQWGSDKDTIYTIPKITGGLKGYYISQENYTDKFGTKDVLSPIGEGNNRFYVMSLKDINGGQYEWYHAALYNGISDYLTLISTNFGTGKTNTDTMIEKWNAEMYGKKDKGEHVDVWGVIQTEAKNGWFIASREEWAAFGNELGVTEETYDGLGLSPYYWTSCMRTNHYAIWAMVSNSHFRERSKLF